MFSTNAFFIVMSIYRRHQKSGPASRLILRESVAFQTLWELSMAHFFPCIVSLISKAGIVEKDSQHSISRFVYLEFICLPFANHYLGCCGL